METIEIILLTAIVAVCANLEPRNSTTNPPKAKLTVSPDRPEFYTGEKIQLQCEIEGDSSGWTIEWMKNDWSSKNDATRTITAGHSESGKYTCKGKLDNREVTTQQSNAFQLIVKDPPKAKLTVSPELTEFYTGEQVRLQCGVEDRSSGWTFQWMKNGQKYQDGGPSTITVNADSGKYKCIGKLDNSEVTTQGSDPFELNVKDPPKAKLTVSPDRPEFYTGEKIHLQCEIEGDSSGWTIEWRKNDRVSKNDAALTITAHPTEFGKYSCKGKLNNREVTTQQSNAFQLKVKDLPKAKLTVSPERPEFYTGEQVSLQCGAKDRSSGWTFQLMKNGHKYRDAGASTITVKNADSGKYTCIGKLEKREVTTQGSDAFQLNIKDIPKAKLTVDPKWKEFFPKERISLQCRIQDGSSGWTFQWTRNYQKLENDKYNLDFDVKPADSGEYTCTGKLINREVTTQKSDAFQLNVKDIPKPTLNVDPKWNEFFPNEKISLQCEIQDGSSGWTFQWTRNDQKLENDKFSLEFDVNHADSGGYACTAKLNNREVTTQKSDAFQLNVKENWPKPSLNRNLDVPVIYAGEEVTISCEVNVQSSNWEFLWFKDSDNINPASSKHSIRHAGVSDSGNYRCQVRRRGLTSFMSDPHNLTVKERPKAEVALQWSEAFVGETMSLQCMIQAESEEWSYEWFKGSEEIVSSDGKMIKGNTLMLSVTSSHQGPYACQAELPDRKVKTDKSETQSLTVHDLSPAVLTLETELNDIIVGEMTLKCEVSDDRQWNYTWYENRQIINGSSQQLKVPANEETIQSKFICKGIRTERPHFSSESEVFTANNILSKRKILLAISGFVVCCIVILIIGCVVLKITRKPEKKETPQVDLFFSMADSKNQTASPVNEYMEYIPAEKKECEEKEELLTDRASVVHEDGVVKDEDTPAGGANGMTSFKGI